MRNRSTLSRLVRGGVAPVAALAALLAVSACAAGNAPVAAAVPQDRSPLAAPPASMMTPHGY